MEFALYIHYPFCHSRCPYCGFATDLDDNDLSQVYRQALLTEIRQRSRQIPWKDGRIGSIYFGGGTPSLMPVEFVADLLQLAADCWIIADDCEVSLEANPESSSAEKFAQLRSAGVNRLSIGAQSFLASELRTLGRIHDAAQVFDAVGMAKSAGFDNFSLDLIYGIPGQTPASLAESVDQALSTGLHHLSTYSLSIEKDTPWEKLVKTGRLSVPDNDSTAEMYLVICGIMRSAGFEHYELTNYAVPGFRSRHNFRYWQRLPYLGIGTGAHSFDGTRRFWNTRQTEQYIRSLDSAQSPAENEELLTGEMIIEEIVYLSLRTCLGLDQDFAREHCKEDMLKNLAQEDYLFSKQGRYHVPEDKWLLLDEIVLRLLRA